jgi:hypothetical protein
MCDPGGSALAPEVRISIDDPRAGDVGGLVERDLESAGMDS